MPLRHQVTIGSDDGIDVDALAEWLEIAFNVYAVVGNWENGIPEGMLILETRES